MDKTPSELGTYIREAIQEPGRSENWLADRSGIPRVTLRRRLDSPEHFTLDELIRVSVALEVKLSALTEIFTSAPQKQAA